MYCNCVSPDDWQHDQLVLLEDQINRKIHGSDPGTDVGYWEALLAQLKAHMARVRVGRGTKDNPPKAAYFGLYSFCSYCIWYLISDICLLIVGWWLLKMLYFFTG